ncbi:hypothetical protein ACE1ET_08360 [Saccharicrinis sp. FJH62]|uniref:hypothetical protein n=1 Tax=Saccharicrinis sp. FJH62 TaxID=3344657 RepID=UPI0035D49CF8
MDKISTHTRYKIAGICFCLAYLALMLFGLRYIFAQSFIPYHETALGTKWDNMPESFHMLYLALMKVAGGGMLSTGIAGEILICIPFRKFEPWARWSLLVIGLIVGGMALTAAITIKLNTPASPPWILTLCSIILILAGFFLSSGMKKFNLPVVE